MKDYFKYLISKPGKIIWMLGGILFNVIGAVAMTINMDSFLEDNPLWLIVFLYLFMACVTVAFVMHPYIEWRDGAGRLKR